MDSARRSERIAEQDRVAVLTEPGTILLEPRPVPTPAEQEVLVEIHAVGVCGSDIHFYEHGRIGAAVVRSPLILGHEAAGEIVALGDRVSKRQIGERVSVEPGVPCGRCRECRTGRYNLCPDVVFLATPPIDGAFRRYVAIHEDFVFPIPDSMSDDAAALMEPLSCAMWACRKAEIAPGDRVLITGAGPIGLLTLPVARASGAAQVEITDTNRHRLEMATTLGASRTIIPDQDEPSEADKMIECSGVRSALRTGIAAVRPAGTVVAVGMGPSGEAEIPLNVIQKHELWLTGTFRYANTYPAAIRLVQEGLVDVEAIITGRFGLDEAESALTAGHTDPASVKAMVDPRLASLRAPASPGGSARTVL